MTGRLKARREFLAAAAGRRIARSSFVLQALSRNDDSPPRFGFTVSKRTAKSAVERNRIRRRLKEAVRNAAGANALRGHDYVVIGRRRALTEPFADLAASLAGAVRHASLTMEGNPPQARKAGG